MSKAATILEAVETQTGKKAKEILKDFPAFKGWGTDQWDTLGQSLKRMKATKPLFGGAFRVFIDYLLMNDVAGIDKSFPASLGYLSAAGFTDRDLQSLIDGNILEVNKVVVGKVLDASNVTSQEKEVFAGMDKRGRAEMYELTNLFKKFVLPFLKDTSVLNNIKESVEGNMEKQKLSIQESISVLKNLLSAGNDELLKPIQVEAKKEQKPAPQFKDHEAKALEGLLDSLAIYLAGLEKEGISFDTPKDAMDFVLAALNAVRTTAKSELAQRLRMFDRQGSRLTATKARQALSRIK